MSHTTTSRDRHYDRTYARYADCARHQLEDLRAGKREVRSMAADNDHWDRVDELTAEIAALDDLLAEVN